jgi:hypothetical protein
MTSPLMPFGMIYRNRGKVPPNAGKGTEPDYDYAHAHENKRIFTEHRSVGIAD